MKKLALTLIIGMLSAGSVLADNKMQNNQNQEDDLLHGYRPVEASQSEPAVTGEVTNNQNQEDDLVHGYRPVDATKGEAAQVSEMRNNQQQEDDKVYGYRN